MRNLAFGRLAAEFFVIVVGVLVALGVDQWRDSVNDRAAEAEYLERLLVDLRQDSITISSDRAQGAAKAVDLERLIENLRDPARVRRQPSLAWPNLSRTFARPNLQTTTFDELTTTGGLVLIENKELRSRIGQHYTWALHSFDERLDERRTSLAALVTRVFPRFPGAPGLALPNNLDDEWTAPRDSAFFASPNLDARMNILFSVEFEGLVGLELDYALAIERIDGAVLEATIELMDAIRAEQAVGR